MKKVVFILATCISLFALDDTFENRTKEAQKYIEIIALKQTFYDTFEQILNKKTLSEIEKQKTKELVFKYLDIDEFIVEMRDVIVKHYTADELVAMNNFYSSAEGKSVLKKQSVATVDMNSKIQNTVLKMFMKMMGDKSLQKNKTAPKGEASQTAI